MELLAPGFPLEVFQLTILTTVLLLVASWIVILTATKAGWDKKLLWLIVTALLPLAGPLVFFLWRWRRSKRFSH